MIGLICHSVNESFIKFISYKYLMCICLLYIKINVIYNQALLYIITCGY